MDLLKKSSKQCLLNNNKIKSKFKNFKIPKIEHNLFFNKLQKEFIYYYKKNSQKINQKSIIWKKIDKISNQNSYFIAKKFQEKIKQLKYSYVFQYTNNLLYFKSNKKINKKIPEKIVYMLILINTLKDLFQRNKCSQQVIFYDLYDKKSLPSKKNNYIDQVNCNSAFCSVQYDEYINGPIVLFRNEESLKVLIHELIHSNFIDYEIIHGHGVEKISSQICTKYPILLNEGFTETFGSLLHMIFVSYITKISIQTIFTNECIHNLIIMNKIIKYFSIKEMEDILSLFGCKKEFKQKTNVFSYYIIKIINYLNINDFLNLVNKNCFNNYALKKSFNLNFVDFILKNIKCLNQYIRDDLNINSKSLRLTCYEVIYI